MAAYALRRVLWTPPLLFFIALSTFLLMHAVPGGPWDTRGRPISPQLEAQLEEKYGLGEPIWRQFLTFLWNALHGDLGVSFQYQDRAVTSVIWDGMEVSVVLGGLALVFALVTGIALGALTAVKRDSFFDRCVLGITAFLASTPSFVLGVLLIVVFSVKLGWLPVFGWEKTWWVLPYWKQAILPVLTLGALPAAYLARITRSAVLETLSRDYVRVARAKGLREGAVISRHVLRNSLIPVLAVSGPLAASLIAGSFIVETVFAVPGLGRQFVDAIFQRDYGLITGITILYACVVVLANLAVDLVHGALDPRLRDKGYG